MTGLPDSILIAFWVVGSCWAVALVAWLIEGTTGAVLPLVIGGVLAGAAEWIIRRNHR
jgi:hypothetical protein